VSWQEGQAMPAMYFPLALSAAPTGWRHDGQRACDPAARP